MPKRNSGRTTLQSLVHHARKFDAVGLLLLSTGVALFLQPFNLYAYQGQGCSSLLVVSMLTIGIVSMILFVIWEKFFAPVSFFPYRLLLDRALEVRRLLTLHMSICKLQCLEQLLQVLPTGCPGP